jgi:hypothetical protein
MALSIRFLLFTAILLAPAASSAWAQTGGPYELSWASIDSGGGPMDGGVYDLVSTVGQPEAGDTQRGGGYSLNAGLVDAGKSGGEPAPMRKVYLPHVIR